MLKYIQLITINYGILILNINNKPLQLPVISCFYIMWGCTRTSVSTSHDLKRFSPDTPFELQDTARRRVDVRNEYSCNLHPLIWSHEVHKEQSIITITLFPKVLKFSRQTIILIICIIFKIRFSAITNGFPNTRKD